MEKHSYQGIIFAILIRCLDITLCFTIKLSIITYCPECTAQYVMGCCKKLLHINVDEEVQPLAMAPELY